MAENPYSYDSESQTEQRPQRRPGIDFVALIMGLATLCASAYVLTDGATWLPPFNVRWILAGGAILAGAMMLAASMRRK